MEKEQSGQVEDLLRETIAALPQYSRRPVATYRLQLNREFGFREAAGLVPYLHSLGVSDLYASPYLKAAPGSMHGYDLVDHNELNPELGSREDYDGLVQELARHSMGHLLDFVPNHMATSSENPLWMDVLENGPSSVQAHFFDIDWKPIKEELENRVLVPMLGDQYGAVLERGELKLSFENGCFQIHYFEHRFPVALRQYTKILTYRQEELQRSLAPGDVHYDDLLSIVTALSKLPPRSEQDPARMAERNREKEAIKRRIAALCQAAPSIQDFIQENVRRFNGTPGEPRSFDLLDGLLREQTYRLAYWRVAAEEINFRRFFDINGLAAIRMEDPRVMQRAHALVFQLAADHKLWGLRIDHPDGLSCPSDYFAALQGELAVAIARQKFMARAAAEPAEEAWSAIEPEIRERVRSETGRGSESALFRPFYVVAEKILSRGEPIPKSWAIHGTTGYDFLNAVNGLFVDESNAQSMDETFARFTGLKLDWSEQVYQKRRQVMSDSMSSEINLLARQLNRLSERDRRTRDFTLNSLTRGLVEVLACFPVYRTYITCEGGPAEDRDTRYVELAVRRAKLRNPTVNVSIFDFIREVLLGLGDGRISEQTRAERLQLALKVQQVTSPVMAKAVEDTVYYLYNRLVSLNEVGGQPDAFGTSVESFHAQNRARAERWPFGLTATSTHDTKRSEDVRARINVLSEMPGEWRRRLGIWSRLNRRYKVNVNDRPAPDRNEEYLLYQILVGTWPFAPPEGSELEEYRARIAAYMQKAIKEAKVNTSWVNPDDGWDRAVAEFVNVVLDPVRSNRFQRDLITFVQRVARAGAFNSLAQVVLKIASPGAPDFYQGNEVWDFSLVDPDNRRPVDFALRRGLLAELDAAREAEPRGQLARRLLGSLEDGRVKLYVTSEGLRMRCRLPDLFRQGEYLPLTAVGERAKHVVAFSRRWDGRTLIAVVPRLVSPLLDRSADLSGDRVWEDTFIEVPFSAEARYQDIFTGERVEIVDRAGRPGLALRDLFKGFPVVLALDEELANEQVSIEPTAPAAAPP